MTVTIAVLTLVWLVDDVDRAVVPLALPAISHDDEHRLVYLVDGEDVVILQARYHYG